MKKSIAFLLLAVGLVAAPTTPISNAVIQVNGTAQSGVLAGNGAGVATATAIGAQISTAIDLIGSMRGSVLYRGAAGWSILAPGTSGYVLTSAGAGADPAWSPEGSVGTVTSFSAGNLSPLFTTNVATATTTPALTFSLSNAAANRVFAGPTNGADASPAFRALVTADMPSGTGDVIGPASSTLNAWPLFSDTTGKLLKNSDVTYSSPTLSVPAGYAVNGAGALAFAAGASSNISLTPGGTTGDVVIPDNGAATGRDFIIGSTSGPAFGSGINVVRSGAVSVLQLESYDSTSATGSSHIFLRARGTSASPSAITTDDQIVGLNARGYYGGGTPAFSSGSRVDMAFCAGESWSDSTHNGTYIRFRATPNASGTAQEVLRLSSTSTASVLTGGPFNMTLVSGTGASRTLTFQTTTSGSTATNALVLSDTQSATFNGPIIQKVSALTYASPTSVNVVLGNVYTVTTVNATGSVTFNASAGGASGQSMTIIITNDATSAKTITFGSNFVANGTLTPSGVNKVATIQFISNGTNFYEVSRTILP